MALSHCPLGYGDAISKVQISNTTWYWHLQYSSNLYLRKTPHKSVMWCCLEWMPEDLIDSQSTLVQVMAWCHQAKSYYLSQCWPRSMLLYGLSRPRWVKVSDTFVAYQDPCDMVLVHSAWWLQMAWHRIYSYHDAPDQLLHICGAST